MNIRKSFSLVRFSLRAMLVVVTVICGFLAYHVNWIHQRRELLREQVAKRVSLVALLGEWSNAISQNNVVAPTNYLCRDAPGFLRYCGEQGYHHIAIIIPVSDTVTRRVAATGFDTLDALNSQPDYVRAQRLYPEATVYLYVINDSRAQPVNVKDAKTGKVVKGIMEQGNYHWEQMSDSRTWAIFSDRLFSLHSRPTTVEQDN